MIALEKARSLIRKAPNSESSRVVQQLISGLENGNPIPLTAIYKIDYADFELCLEIIEGWRLHCYGRSYRRAPRGHATGRGFDQESIRQASL
jgi:hypothetical protein